MTVSVADAQTRLPELIAALKPGEDVVITADDRPVARLVAEGPPTREPRKLGTLRGSVLYMAPDFDATPEDFKEYTE